MFSEPLLASLLGVLMLMTCTVRRWVDWAFGAFVVSFFVGLAFSKR